MSSRRVPVLVVLAALGGALAAQERGFDPLQGIDPDGRIERPALPEGLPNPQRWRFVPEGRIVPGSPLDRLYQTSFAFPQVFAEPDIGFGFGLALTDIDFRNQRRREFAGIFLSYTTEGQQNFRTIWRRFTNTIDLPEGGVLQDERAFWSAGLGYTKTLTRRFYGFGADTTSQDETSYTEEVTAAQFGRQWTLGEAAGDWIVGLGTSAVFRNLAGGRVSGVPTTEQVFPEVVGDGDREAMWWFGAELEYNTRDSLHSPHRGFTASASVRAAPLQSSGDLGGRYGLSLTQVFPVPSPFHDGGRGREENPPTDTVAFGAFTTGTFGELPFYELPSLGGPSTLRGYINDRFTDRAAWHASAEYRFWFVPRGFRITDRIRIERVGAALFYDVGSVDDTWAGSFSSTVRDAYGFGLRLHLERLALFRIDFGFSEEDVNFTINYGLPF